MTTIVTHDLLVRLNACSPYRARFRELFPNGVIVTEELCVKHADDFLWDWAGSELLPEKASAMFWDFHYQELDRLKVDQDNMVDMYARSVAGNVSTAWGTESYRQYRARYEERRLEFRRAIAGQFGILVEQYGIGYPE